MQCARIRIRNGLFCERYKARISGMGYRWGGLNPCLCTYSNVIDKSLSFAFTDDSVKVRRSSGPTCEDRDSYCLVSRVKDGDKRDWKYFFIFF